VTIRSSEVHLYYNLQVFYWHFLESLWLFIFLVSVSTQKRSY
jgi:heme/copper-type cytochrome/quinol oxidase subunit 3